MSADRPFTFALIGSGNIGGTYAKAIANLDGVALSGLVSRSGRCPNYLPAGIEVAASLAELTRPHDAVILCTPNGTHHSLAKEAASLGKHVLTEKVLDINRENMDTMTQACEDAGVTLAVTFQRRMSPDNAAIKHLLDSSALGKVFAADMRVKFFRDMDYYNSGDYRGGYTIDGGGPFIQQAAHNVDIFAWFFGMPKKVVSMLDTFTHDIEAEDHGVALLRYENGMIGTITASSATKPGFTPVLEIHSDRGSVIMENDEITAWHIDGVAQPERAADFEVHSGAASAVVSDTAGHEAILRDFVEAVRNGTPPAIPASSGRLATELVLQIYEANVR
ncbi:MAG: UDP-N-acetyl-2-amino-2-deoxyglucuronate dehydrogenase [Verrucomicrobiales bacterium]